MKLIVYTLTVIMAVVLIAVAVIVYATFFTLCLPLLATRSGRRLLLGRYA